jgi:hypothetical protein
MRSASFSLVMIADCHGWLGNKNVRGQAINCERKRKFKANGCRAGD